MGEGYTATDALESAMAADPASFLRQVGVVSAAGDVGSMTGEWCLDHAGHLLGDGCAVQANMMASPQVWPAMADAYTAATGTFPRRLLAAVLAAQTAGGDARGPMAGALVVGGPERMPDPWDGQLMSVRVDRSPDPLADLATLIDAA